MSHCNRSSAPASTVFRLLDATRAAPASPDAPYAEAMLDYNLATRNALRMSTTFRFASGSHQLDVRGQEDLDRVAEFLRNPANQRFRVGVLGFTDPAGCSFQFSPSGAAMFIQPCYIAKLALGYLSVNYSVERDAGREIAAVRVAGGPLIGADSPTFARDLRSALIMAGYPSATNVSAVRMAHPLDLFHERTLALIGLLTILVLYVTMVFDPIAAALVELFPTRIRFTGMSLPYQLGNGWFGGLLPATVVAMSAETGGIDFGLWYPVVIAFCTATIGFLLVPETKDRDIEAEEMVETNVTPVAALASRTIN